MVEIPPEPLPQPVATAPIVLPQTHTRVHATCEPPRDLAGCTAMGQLRVGRVELSSPTCFVDTKVRAGDEGRLMKCPSGVVAVFPRVSFGGYMNDHGIETCARTQFPFSDGCTWETVQRMRGGPSLIEYTYEERPTSGGRCAPSSCTARADVEVSQP